MINDIPHSGIWFWFHLKGMFFRHFRRHGQDFELALLGFAIAAKQNKNLERSKITGAKGTSTPKPKKVYN